MGEGEMRKQSLLAFFVSPTLVAGTVALAQDAKIFPGTMCQPKVEDDAPFEREEETGIIRNVGSDFGVLFCPIVRDLSGVDTFEFAEIVFEGDVECDLVSMTREGQEVERLGGGAVETPDDPRTPPRIDLGGGRGAFEFAPGSPDIASEAFGYYFFLCFPAGQTPDLPQGAGIISYTTLEQ
jgi:hypothetical protein